MTWRWKLLIGVVTLFLLSAIAISLWYCSQADIRQVIAQAKAAGIATTGEELGWKDPTPEQNVRMNRVLGFASLASFRDCAENMAHYPRLGEPPSAELRAYIEGLAPASLPQLSVAIDELGDDSWFQYGHMDLKQGFPEVSAQRQLTRLMGEKIRLADRHELPRLARQGLRLSLLTREQCLLGRLVNISCVAIVTGDLTARLPELRGTPEGTAVGSLLHATRDHLWQQRSSAAAGELVVTLSSLNLIERYSSLSTGLGSPSSGEEWAKQLLRPSISRLAWRVQRAQILRSLVATAKAYEHEPDLASLITAVLAAEPPPSIWDRLASWSGGYTATELLASRVMLLNGMIRSLQTLDVLIAELEQTAPANDLFAKPGEPVRPILRDGKRIGWYSVGPNGIDDGGMNAKDFAIPISEKLGRIRFSDPLEPRVPPALPAPSAP